MPRFVLLLTIFSAPALWAQNTGIISTVAGNGTAGDTGDGGPATSAEIGISGQGMTADTQGNLYIMNGAYIREVNSAGIINKIAGGGGATTNGGQALDEAIGATGMVVDNQGNYYLAYGGYVLKVSTAGIVTFFAGNGIGGDLGDGGPATSAQVFAANVALDGAGNLYICETDTNRIRKVDTNGIITTVAGTGNAGRTGDGGPATSAELDLPQGMAVDYAGNIYFADNFDYIRKVNTAGVISTIAGDGSPISITEGTAALSTGMTPVFVAVDGAGNLYYVDAGLTGRIRQINTSGIVRTVAGSLNTFNLGDGGPATSAQLESPTGVAIDNSGNIYIADTGHERIRKVPGVAAPGNAGSGSGSVSGAAPSISANGVVNGASFGPGLVVGSWATIQGTNLASSTGEWNVVNGILPITVNDVTVDFGGNDAYIYYVSATQINFIVPDVRTGTEQVTVKNSAGTSQTASVTVDNFAPAFFLWPNNQVVATYQDFTYAAAGGTFTGVTTTAAKPGDTIILWGTGFGGTDPAFPQGMVTPTTGGPYNTDPVSVTIDNLPATVYGGALAPGFAGLYQIAIQVPSSLGSGNWPVVATIDGVSSPAGPVLAVQ